MRKIAQLPTKSVSSALRCSLFYFAMLQTTISSLPSAHQTEWQITREKNIRQGRCVLIIRCLWIWGVVELLLFLFLAIILSPPLLKLFGCLSVIFLAFFIFFPLFPIVSEEGHRVCFHGSAMDPVSCASATTELELRSVPFHQWLGLERPTVNCIRCLQLHGYGVGS